MLRQRFKSNSVWLDPAVAGLVAVLVLTAGFLAFPDVDEAVSAAFYWPGHGFYLAANHALITFRNSADTLVIIAVCLLLATLR